MKQEFQTEQERLFWLIQEVEKQTEQLNINIQSDDEAELLLVCSTFIRLALAYAKGVHLLIEQQLITAAAPIERSIYEMWVEHRYLLSVGLKTENARKIMINATMELRDFIQKNNDQFSAEQKKDFNKSLISYKTEYPDLYMIIERQRKQRFYHWSGISRSRMEQVVSVPGTANIYQYLSWEAHAVMSPIRDIHLNTNKEGTVKSLEFKMLADAEEESERIAWTVGGILFYMWNDYAEQFGLNLIDTE